MRWNLMNNNNDEDKVLKRSPSYNFDNISKGMRAYEDTLNSIDMSAITKGLQVYRDTLNSIDMSAITKGLQVYRDTLNSIDMSAITKGLQVYRDTLNSIDMSAITKGLQMYRNTLNSIDMSVIAKGLQEYHKTFSSVNMSHVVRIVQEYQHRLNATGIKVCSDEVDVLKISQAITDEELLQNVDSKQLNEILAEYSFLNFDESLDSPNNKIKDEISDYEKQINISFSNILEILDLKANSFFMKLSGFREKHPALCLIFVTLYFVVQPAMDEVKKDAILNSVNYEDQTPKQNAKKIKKELIITFESDNYFLNNVRVTNQKTSVFHSSSQKSKRIGFIASKRPVVVLSKKKNWSLVIYKDDDKVEYSGWVFTGNLSK